MRVKCSSHLCIKVLECSWYMLTSWLCHLENKYNGKCIEWLINKMWCMSTCTSIWYTYHQRYKMLWEICIIFGSFDTCIMVVSQHQLIHWWLWEINVKSYKVTNKLITISLITRYHCRDLDSQSILLHTHRDVFGLHHRAKFFTWSWNVDTLQCSYEHVSGKFW